MTGRFSNRPYGGARMTGRFSNRPYGGAGMTGGSRTGPTDGGAGFPVFPRLRNFVDLLVFMRSKYGHTPDPKIGIFEKFYFVLRPWVMCLGCPKNC
jgi:hypothetical protein